MNQRSNLYVSDFSKVNWAERIQTMFTFFKKGSQEFYYGVKSRTFPWAGCHLIATFLCIGILLNVDTLLFNLLHIPILNPKGTKLYWYYCVFVLSAPFWIWTLAKLIRARKERQRFSSALILSGLKNELGKVPAIVIDKPLDEFTRRLRLSKAGFTEKDFQSRKQQLQESLQIFIDELKENREQGTIDITYGHHPMPTFISLKDKLKNVGPREFIVGYTRSREIRGNLKETPHLMIAGISNGGKSTFLRQFVTTLYLKNPNSGFTLIDLKGGVEFQMFQKYKRMQITDTVQAAIQSLSSVATLLDARLKLLKANDVKDIYAFEQIPMENRKTTENSSVIGDLSPRFVVIDEAAEMFLAGSHASSKHIQSARNALSQIARQGRAVGVHLIIATQRPDVKAVDSQVKANLGGVLSFHMANDSSSITVLGNGRATDLPSIPGRGIWKVGGDMVELQTPFLSTEDVELLLSNHIKTEPDKEKETPKKKIKKGVKDSQLTDFPILSQNPQTENEEGGKS